MPCPCRGKTAGRGAGATGVGREKHESDAKGTGLKTRHYEMLGWIPAPT